MLGMGKMKSRIMYIEPKGRDSHTDDAPARIGRVTFSKSGKTLRYRGRTLVRRQGFCANYVDEETGDQYWVSGCKKRGGDRLFPGIIEIDGDVREEYWLSIRETPECKEQTVIRCVGKYGGKQGRR